MLTTSSSTPTPTNGSDSPVCGGQERPGKPVDPPTLLEQVRSGQVWLVKGMGSHGLLLEKTHIVELLEFGAAVGLAIDRDCRAVLPIGHVYLQAPATFLERQWGYRRRGHSAEIMQKLTEAYPSRRRAVLLWQHLYQRFSPASLASVPDEWLGRLVGVSEDLIQHCRQTGGLEAM